MANTARAGSKPCEALAARITTMRLAHEDAVRALEAGQPELALLALYQVDPPTVRRRRR